MSRLLRPSIAPRAALLALLLLGTPARGRPAALADPVIVIVPLGPSSERGNGAAVAVDARDGRVFAAGSGTTTSQISVLDAATGVVLHTVTDGPIVQGGIEGIAVDEARGRALVVTDPDLIGQGQGPPGRVSTLDARDGRTLRSTVVGPAPRPVALDERQGHYFALTTDANGRGHVAMVDTTSGRVLRVAAIAAGMGTYEGPQGVALDEARARLFVATVGPDFRGYLSVLDTGSGALVRTVALGPALGGSGSVVANERAARVFVASNYRVLVLDARDGHALRTIAAGAAVYAMVADAGTGHVFAEAGQDVLMLDARDGTLLRRTPVPGLPDALLTDIGPSGRVFVTSPGKTSVLSVLDAATGALVRTLKSGANNPQIGLVRAIDGRTGRVFETISGPSQEGSPSSIGIVIVRDARSGLVRQAVQVGSDPVEIALDARTGTAFALDRVDATLTVLAPSFGATPPLPPQPTRPALPSLPRILPFTGYVAVADVRTGRAFIGGGRVAGGARTTTGTPRIEGVVRVVDTATGALLHTVTIGGMPGGPGALAVDEATGHVYVAIDDTDRVAVLDARTGALLCMVHVAGQPRALALAVGSGKLFIAVRDDPRTKAAGGVSVLDTRTGTIRRVIVRAKAAPAMDSVAVDPASMLAYATDPLANTLTILDARSGALLRTVRVPCYQPGAVVATAGKAFVIGDGVCVLDGRTGAQLHTYEQGVGGVDTVMAVGRTARVFAVSSPAFVPTVAVLDARTGALLRHVQPAQTVESSTATAQPVADEGRDRVYVLLSSPFGRDNEIEGPGALAILDAKTGSVIKDVALDDTVAGGPDFGLALDARLHHLIVMTDNHVTVLDAARL